MQLAYEGVTHRSMYLGIAAVGMHALFSAGQQRQEQDLNAIDGETILSQSKFSVRNLIFALAQSLYESVISAETQLHNYM
jgi:hypothetical protein